MLNRATPFPHQFKHWLQLGPVKGNWQIHVEQVESIVPLPLQTREFAAVVLQIVQDPFASLINFGSQIQLQFGVVFPFTK